jgi:hypothetical protein
MLPGDPRPPEQVIKPEYLAAYKTAHADIYHRLIQINTSIEILETVAQYHYPLTCIFSPQDPFFVMLHWNFTYTCVIMLHGLLDDSEGYTLRNFKNNLLKSWGSDIEQQALRSRLKSFRFSDKFNSLVKRLVDLRHKVIAHRDPCVVDGSLSIPGLSIKDLRAIYSETEALFGACSFHAEYFTTLHPEGTVRGNPIEKDIERIMNLLVKYSHWINQPEIKAQFWPVIRQGISQAEIEELNRWREKLGLPPA